MINDMPANRMLLPSHTRADPDGKLPTTVSTIRQAGHTLTQFLILQDLVEPKMLIHHTSLSDCYLF